MGGGHKGILASRPMVWRDRKVQCGWCVMDYCGKNTSQATTYVWFEEMDPRHMAAGVKVKG